MSLFNSLFKANFSLTEILSQDAQIIDVRSMAEFSSAHAKGSLCLPLNELPNGMDSLDKSKPTVLCCASGMRSGVAKGIFKKAGFENVQNAGSWRKVAQALEAIEK